MRRMSSRRKGRFRGVMLVMVVVVKLTHSMAWLYDFLDSFSVSKGLVGEEDNNKPQ